MTSIITASGYRFDHVRRCHCGRKPQVSTGYEGVDDGTGPFIVSCTHGVPLEDQPEGALNLTFARSWSKTRAARNWNALIRELHA
ncbi:hypothetical protein [Blastomonas sp. CACIA14H2]|uniref:hypothetical protein n=1 Tax=Blastomonas sp. CACIA14H2 TaxID=1419876 RepID=UPI0026B0D02C